MNKTEFFTLIIMPILNILIIPVFFLWVRYYFSKQFQILKTEGIKDLTLHKAEVEIDADEKKLIKEKKRELLPLIDEMVYRARNQAREICNEIIKNSLIKPSNIQELFKMQHELMELMYKDKYYFDKFRNVGKATHSFKNILISFYETVSEKNIDEIDKKGLQKKYALLDSYYENVCKQIQKS